MIWRQIWKNPQDRQPWRSDTMFDFEISQKQEMKNVKQEDEEYQREEKEKNEMCFIFSV